MKMTPKEKRPGGALNSGRPQKRGRLMASTSARASEAEPIERGESEVRDPTTESSDPEIIDLTQDDSDENQRERRNSAPRGQQQSDIANPNRGDPDEPRHNDVYVTAKVLPGTIRCPICMDGYSEIVQSGRQIVSTTCGHVFCSQCLYYSLVHSNFCPTCRTDLAGGQYHPLYI
uniref:RING-type domain-containing protein n=1 Tax=Strigops habroptila TaxID=2489341 RepID=A0A672UPL8_STRHB